MKVILISFSGIDSAGKTTYINFLKKYFFSSGLKYKYIWSRGGYTCFFEFLKKTSRLLTGKILPKSGNSMKRDKMFRNNLISSVWLNLALLDLIFLYSFLARIYLLQGYYIICDRYIWDTYVDFYLKFEKFRLNRNLLWKFLELTYVYPQESFYFFVNPELSLARSILKKEPFSESLSLRRERIKVYEGLQEMRKWSHCFSTETKPINEIWLSVKRIIDNALF